MSRPLNLLAVSFALLLVAGCASVPLDYPREPSYAIADTSETSEAANVEDWLGGRTDINGFYPLSGGFDAFGARLSLMDVAEKSIDAQYFLMKPDNAGLVFSANLMRAADRGVRVRLLLDDVFTNVEDIDLAMIDAHPNIELRIFNPVSRRGIYALNYAGNFKLANRRMHNKAFIVDNQVAVVGGRNIAVEYFQLESSAEFMDFDMLSAGPIVKEVSNEFDTYWNHELAVPMAALHKEDDEKKKAEFRAAIISQMEAAGRTIYGDATSTPLMKQFHDDELPPYIADARLIVDPPQKLLEDVSSEYQTVANELRDMMLAAEKEVLIFTPYFIPGKSGIEFIKQLKSNGIEVIIMTNSLATNNHTAVHSAYSSYRKDLLRAGVNLWEARADAAKTTDDKGEVTGEHLTLHTKAMLIDRRHIFAGSLNLDPRSIDINTEMGLLIDSPEMGALLAKGAMAQVPRLAYRLELDDNDKITWHATIDGKEVIETKDPQTSVWRRMSAWIQKIAPEGQL